MEHYRKLFTSLAVLGLAGVLLTGSALAVPAPTLQKIYTENDQVQTPVPSSQPSHAALVTGQRPTLSRHGGELALARGVPRGGNGAETSTAVRASGKRSSKATFLMSGLVLAATATPIALHRSSDGDANAQTAAANTRPQLGGTLGTTGDAALGGDDGCPGCEDDGSCDNGDCNSDCGGDCGCDCDCDCGDCDNGGDRKSVV